MTDKKWLTIREAAEMTDGRESEWSIREMLKPDHPAVIPHTERPTRGGRTKYLIPADEFAAWLEAHTVS